MRGIVLKMSVCPSVSASFLFSIWSIFRPILFNIGIRVDIGKECLGLQMGNVCDINTELWPLIDVINSFSLSIFGMFYRFFFKLCMSVDVGTEFLGIADGFPNDYRVMALD